eukprot:m.94683 g.94683  ORF g.94683 m.94683 type:complete len:70 (+) comp8929_c3_seq3:57-266(+)
MVRFDQASFGQKQYLLCEETWMVAFLRTWKRVIVLKWYNCDSCFCYMSQLLLSCFMCFTSAAQFVCFFR